MEWTQEELSILMKHYPALGKDVIALLPGRTLSAVYNKAQRCKLRCKKPPITNTPWSVAEFTTLLEYYPEEGDAVCTRLPGRSAIACRHQAHEHGLYRDDITSRRGEHLPGPYHTPWTDKEVEKLKKGYPIFGAGMFRMLPGRSRAAVRCKAQQLHIYYNAKK